MKIKPFVQLAVALAVVLGGYFLVRQLAIPEVVVAPVRRGSATLSATGNVTVLPYAEARIVAPEKGILSKFDYKEGNTVKKGQIIAELDPGRLPFDLKQLEEDLARLREKIKIGSPLQFACNNLKEELEKTKKLFAKGHVAENAVRDVERNLAEVEIKMLLEKLENDYAVRKTEIQIEQLRDQLDRFEMRAPFDGVIMAPGYVNGDLVFSGNSITKVSSIEKLIKAEVNQDDLPAVRKSKRVLVSFFSFPGRDYQGEIKTLVLVGNSSTQRFTVFLKMKELPEQLLSGQTGEATFIADEHHDTLVIPSAAVMGDSVFVAKDGRLEKRKIKMGFPSVTTVEVLSGLEEGELIVIKDVDLQHDGTRVKIQDRK